MSTERLSTPTHLFTVRLWAEELDHGKAEWRGKVTHVLSGEARYFREWQGLITHIRALAAIHSDPPGNQLTEHD